MIRKETLKKFLNTRLNFKYPVVPRHERIRPWPFRVGDKVEIIKGPDSGKRGRIVSEFSDSNVVVVQDHNITCQSLQSIVDTAKPEKKYIEKGICAKEVRLIDPSNDKPVKVYFKEGKRYSVLSDGIIEYPPTSEDIKKKLPIENHQTQENSAKEFTWKMNLRQHVFPVSLENEIYRLSRNRSEKRALFNRYKPKYYL